MNPPTPTIATHLPKLSSSRRKGLTAIISKAQGRGPQEASGWLNPEDSIGPYIGRNAWTRLKFWEADGPARDAFLDMVPKIKKFLEDTVEPIYNSGVTWSMYMIGRAPSQASPSIIFCCEVLWHRRHVRDVIRESGILEDYPPGIKTGHLPRPPGFNPLVPLASPDKPLYNRVGMIALTAHDRSACGSQICESALRTHAVTHSAVATIGGIIRLGTRYYFMTAAHTISLDPNSSTEGEEWAAEDPHGSRLSLDGDEDIYIRSNPNVNTDNLSISHSPSRESEGSDENRYLRDDIVRQWSLKEYNEAEEPLLPLPDPGKMSPVRTGTPFMTSMDVGYQATGLDYALLPMRSPHQTVENVITIGIEHEHIVKVHSFVRSVPRDIDVFAVTSRGSIKGRISATPVYSSAPGQRTYNRMLKVSLSSPLQRGDCGTWGVDAIRGHLVGHVVLGSPGSNIALLVPFADVFDDILSRTGSPPVFPRARDDGAVTPGVDDTPYIQYALETMTRQGLDSLTNRAVDQTPSPPVSFSEIIAPIVELPSTSTSLGPKGRPKSLSKQTAPEARGPTAQANTSGKTAVALSSAMHNDPALHVKTEKGESVGKASDGSGRLMEQESRSPWQQKEQDRPFFEPSARLNSSLPRGLTTNEGLGVPMQSSRPQSQVSHFERPPAPPAPVKAPKFRDVLLTFSKAPLEWENAELLAHVLKEIDLNAIVAEADEEAKDLKPSARSCAIRDCQIRTLSEYFREKFFTKIKKPPCETCSTELPTIARGHVRPTPEEESGKAQVVELYQCADKHCQAYTRFPRYWDVSNLFRNPRGRAGEAANCFGMLCRALGSRVRWVWNAEDRIWTEVYSEHQERWVHVDAYEGAWDKPLMYTEKMGKKLSYCIAFSVDGATDVTRRYVRSSDHAAPRTQCSEVELLSILDDIKAMRRGQMSEEDQIRLENEDAAEARELGLYIYPSVALTSAQSRPGQETAIPRYANLEFSSSKDRAVTMLEKADRPPPMDFKAHSAMKLGPSSKEKGVTAPVTSATRYPGQEWSSLADGLRNPTWYMI